MIPEKRVSELPGLPEFLKVSIEKGLIDEATARRIELFRKTRGLGTYEGFSDLLSTPPDPTMTFETFISCKGNAFALELALMVSTQDTLPLPYNPLYIYGDVGLGKTHLLSAIASASAGRSVLLASTLDLAAELNRAREEGSLQELREWLMAKEILLLDDVQFCEDQEDNQIELFSILNHKMKAHRWVVITSDVYPTRLEGMQSRLLSRLSGGVIVGLQMGDKAERMEMVSRFPGSDALPAEVLEYLAETISDNVRHLKSGVGQLLAAQSAFRSPMTREDAQRILASGLTAGHSVTPDGEPGSPQAENLLDDAATPSEGAQRFKEMLAGAETEEEQVLALQIAVGERIRQLRTDGSDPTSLKRLELVLGMLREGDLHGAMAVMSA